MLRAGAIVLFALMAAGSGHRIPAATAKALTVSFTALALPGLALLAVRNKWFPGKKDPAEIL
ncbi:MAG TPA: hypothetical protein VHK69_01630 [Chitinophagaceae bacterium]|nr:hypothetical protein [Chitinophagaceae bacterium]